MVVVDSLVFPDLVITMILIIIILLLIVYVTNQLIELSMIDYKASMGTYLFLKCQLGNFTIHLNHVIITNGTSSSNYLLICPQLVVNGSQIGAKVYTAYVKW